MKTPVELQTKKGMVHAYAVQSDDGRPLLSLRYTPHGCGECEINTAYPTPAQRDAAIAALTPEAALAAVAENWEIMDEVMAEREL